MKKLHLALGIFLLSGFLSTLSAQSIQFSQFYSSPAILGPSFCGLSGRSRASINYRDQWPNIPGVFRTYSFMLDHWINKRGSGVGLSFFRDEAGTGNLRLTNIALHYTYEVPLTRHLAFRPGLSFSWSERDVDFYKLTFGSQLTSSGTVQPGGAVPEPEPRAARYPDASASLLLHHSKHFWFGVTAGHILLQDQSFAVSDGVTSKVPLLVMAYGGYQIELRNKKRRKTKEYLTITTLFKKQASFQQLDIGAYWQRRGLKAGLWYRGLPFLSNTSDPDNIYRNTDAVVLMLGYRFNSLSVGYSYDITVSQLLRDTHGSHEISLVYDFNVNQKRNPKRRKGAIPCPANATPYRR